MVKALKPQDSTIDTSSCDASVLVADVSSRMQCILSSDLVELEKWPCSVSGLFLFALGRYTSHIVFKHRSTRCLIITLSGMFALRVELLGKGWHDMAASVAHTTGFVHKNDDLQGSIKCTYLARSSEGDDAKILVLP